MIYQTKDELKQAISLLKKTNKTIGFVPTMGALHEGHLSLIKEAKNNCDQVVVSIFVNPTQFDNSSDLKHYPRTLNQDVALIKTIVDNVIIYAPTPEDIYDNNVTSEHFDFGGIEHEMEGRFRKGHFNGVGTVVSKLFEIVEPTKAFFGNKDFQQLQIIKKLVEIKNFDIEVIGCKIHREESGLAMSSRNTRLTEEQLSVAPFIYETLNTAKTKFGTKSANYITKWVENQFKKHPILKLEYFIIADTKTLQPVKRKSKNKTYRAFIVAFAGDIRLIDNISLN